MNKERRGVLQDIRIQKDLEAQRKREEELRRLEAEAKRKREEEQRKGN